MASSHVLRKNTTEPSLCVYHAGKITTSYNRGINLVSTSQGEDTYYYVSDEHKNTVKPADANKNIVADYTYDAFGVETDVENNIYNPFRYCGEYQDLCSGLIYLRNRYYDTETGRFISEDPIKDGLNWYVYANSNPVMFVDPMGTDAIILTNEKAVNSGDYTKGKWGNNVFFVHQGSLVQNKDDKWYYFSCGKNYVQFEEIDEKYMTDIKTFSDKYYGGGSYTTSTYIKGDFTKSLNFYKDYYEKNISDNNESSYKIIANNCTVVAMKGILKGELDDGTKISNYMYDFGYNVIPNLNKDVLSAVYFNSAFTYDEYHKTINDQLWEAQNGLNKNRSKANRLKKLY